MIAVLLAVITGLIVGAFLAECALCRREGDRVRSESSRDPSEIHS